MVLCVTGSATISTVLAVDDGIFLITDAVNLQFAEPNEKEEIIQVLGISSSS